MEKEQPALHAAITSNLDYEGYTGAAIGSLNTTKAGDPTFQIDAAKRSSKLDNLPHVSEYRQDGLHKNMPPGHPVPPPEPGETWKEYQTGKNTTFVKNDSLSKITDKEANEAQKDYCTRMSGVIGADVSNPPSTKAAQSYFQQMANKGASPDQQRIPKRASGSSFASTGNRNSAKKAPLPITVPITPGWLRHPEKRQNRNPSRGKGNDPDGCPLAGGGTGTDR